jgi:hypothetical protein
LDFGCVVLLLIVVACPSGMHVILVDVRTTLGDVIGFEVHQVSKLFNTEKTGEDDEITENQRFFSASPGVRASLRTTRGWDRGDLTPGRNQPIIVAVQNA